MPARAHGSFSSTTPRTRRRPPLFWPSMIGPSNHASSARHEGDRVMPISMSTTVLNVGTLATTTSDPATKAQLISLQSELAQHAQDFETERNALIAQNTASQATVTSLNAQIAALGADAAVKANTIADLQRRIATVPAPTVAK